MLKKEKPTAIDLFCGCGGFSLGSIQAGFDVRLGIDMDFPALHTYCANLAGPGLKWYGMKPDRKRMKRQFGEGFPPCDNRSDKDVNWSHTVRAVICDDIRKWHGLDILKAAELDTVDYLMASPPCQGFSSAGKQKVGDVRDFLMIETARLILEIQPGTLCIENVPNMRKKRFPDGENILDLVYRIIKDSDWELYYSLRDKYQPDYPDLIDINQEIMDVAWR